MEYGSFQAEEFGDLQRLVDGLFYDRRAIDRLDLIVQATAGAPSTAPWNKPSHWGLWSKNSKYEYCYFFSNSDFELKRPVLAFCVRFWKDASAFFVQPRNR